MPAAEPPALPSPPRLLRRTSVHPILRFHALLSVWVVGAPLAHLLGAAIGWPRVLGLAGFRRRAGSFGDYAATEHDVFAAVYFKGGTSWTMQIAQQVASRGAGRWSHIHDVVAWPDAMHPRFAVPLSDPGPAAASPTGLRVIKTHLPRPQVPWSPSARYLSVLRDPKDVLVSSYRFVQSIALGPMMPPVSAWLDWFLSDGFPWGSWPAHVASWWAERERDNVLVLTFDGLKADLPGSIDRIAELLGVDLSPAERSAIVARCTFEAMKAEDARFGPGMVVPWGRPEGAMMRRGASGGSAELLTPEQQARIDAWCAAELERLGSDFPYSATFGASSTASRATSSRSRGSA
jgi:hypothetical protein